MLVSVLQHIGLVLFYLLLLVLYAAIFLGIPGGWIALAAIVIFDLATGFTTVGWVLIVVMLLIATLGELIESFLGLVYVAQRGATKWGVLGALLGGIAGAVGGGFLLPFIGSVLLGLAGAFAGAVLLEYLYYRSLDRALQTGFSALGINVIHVDLHEEIRLDRTDCHLLEQVVDRQVQLPATNDPLARVARLDLPAVVAHQVLDGLLKPPIQTRRDHV